MVQTTAFHTIPHREKANTMRISRRSTRKAAGVILPLVLAAGAALTTAAPANAAVTQSGCRNAGNVGHSYMMAPCGFAAGGNTINMGAWMWNGDTDVLLYGRVDVVSGNSAYPWDCNRGPVHIWPSSMQYYDLGACNLQPGTYVVETWITDNGSIIGDLQSSRIVVN